MIGYYLVDGTGKKSRAKVTGNGELVTSPIAYDEAEYRALDEINTAYNFYAPTSGKRFVITGLVLKADKQVSSTVDADVVVYEAGEATSTTASRTIFQMAMVEGDLLALNPINILTTEGVYINAKTTDDDIHVNIMGYYINA